jgi:hypothetical protein
MEVCQHGVNLKHYCELCAVKGKRTAEHDKKKSELLKILQVFDVHSNHDENNDLMNRLMEWGGYVR